MVVSSLRSLTLKDFNPIKHWIDPSTPTSTKVKNLAKSIAILPVAKEFLLLRSWKNVFQIMSAAIKIPRANPESRSDLLNDNWPHIKQGAISLLGIALLYPFDSIDTGYNIDSGHTINSIFNKVYAIFTESSTAIALIDDNILNNYSLFFVGAATYTLGGYLLYYPSSSILHWNAGPAPVPTQDPLPQEQREEQLKEKRQSGGRETLPPRPQSETALKLPTIPPKSAKPALQQPVISSGSSKTDKKKYYTSPKTQSTQTSSAVEERIKRKRRYTESQQKQKEEQQWEQQQGEFIAYSRSKPTERGSVHDLFAED